MSNFLSDSVILYNSNGNNKMLKLKVKWYIFVLVIYKMFLIELPIVIKSK